MRTPACPSGTTRMLTPSRPDIAPMIASFAAALQRIRRRVRSDTPTGGDGPGLRRVARTPPAACAGAKAGRVRMPDRCRTAPCLRQLRKGRSILRSTSTSGTAWLTPLACRCASAAPDGFDLPGASGAPGRSLLYDCVSRGWFRRTGIKLVSPYSPTHSSPSANPSAAMIAPATSANPMKAVHDRCPFWLGLHDAAMQPRHQSALTCWESTYGQTRLLNSWRRKHGVENGTRSDASRQRLAIR